MSIERMFKNESTQTYLERLFMYSVDKFKQDNPNEKHCVQEWFFSEDHQGWFLRLHKVQYSNDRIIMPPAFNETNIITL